MAHSPPAGDDTWSPWTLAGLAVVVMVAAAQVFYYFPRTVDDLFISLRYAEHAAHGLGLTYNREPVEGFSNPLWVALETLFILVGVNGVTATKILGVVSLSGLLGGVFVFGRRLLELPRGLAVLAMLAVAGNAYVVSWSMLGLETPAYLALLLWYPIVLRAGPTGEPRRWGGHLALAAVTVALAASRPEAPLYIVAISAAMASAGGPRRWLERVWQGLAAAAGVLGLLLLARWLTFGALVPHTYFAKPGHGFSAGRLLGLVSEGASPSEALWLLGALLTAAWLAWRRRPVLLAVIVTCMVFISLVAADWMPNQRHALPIHIMAALAWAAAAARVAGLERRPWRYAGLTLLALLGTTVLTESILMDFRYSPDDFKTHGGGQVWVRPKTVEAAVLSWRSLVGEATFPAAPLDRAHLGMVQQVFDVYEASAKPQDETWYVGRDIGRVGWLSEIEVFDTAGLFSPEVVNDPQWIASGGGSPAVVARVFQRDIVAAEILDGWATAARSHVDRGQFFPTQPGHYRSRSTPSPSAAQVLARYRRGARKLPFFQMGTLYGEPVGAAFEKRHAWLEDQLASAPPVHLSAVPDWATMPLSFFDGAVVLHGCRFDREAAKPEAPVRLTCVFESVRPVLQNYQVFVHLVDAGGRVRAKLDHPMALGFHPLPRWRPGEIVVDSIKGPLPKMGPGRLSARVGLWRGADRARPSVAHLTDPEGRVIGPTIAVSGPH